MAQGLKALVVLEEDLGSIPGTHVTANNHLQHQSRRDLNALVWPPRVLQIVVRIHTRKTTHKIKKDFWNLPWQYFIEMSIIKFSLLYFYSL